MIRGNGDFPLRWRSSVGFRQLPPEFGWIENIVIWYLFGPDWYFRDVCPYQAESAGPMLSRHCHPRVTRLYGEGATNWPVFPTATYASALRYSVAYRAGNSSRSRSRKNAGMSSAWTSSRNSRNRADMTPSWWPSTLQVNVLTSSSHHGHCCWGSEPLPSEHLETSWPPAEGRLRPWTAIRRCYMKEPYQLLGIEAATSTAYHPQTDG